jgi:hypothetical protein
MKENVKSLYEFGPFRQDAGERLLLRDCEVVPLTPKAFDSSPPICRGFRRKA